MTTMTKIARSGPVIRAALAELSPMECEQFESEFQQAAQIAAEQFDLTGLEALLDRWWGIATIRANPLTEQEQELRARARGGNDTGLFVREAEGWRQL